MEIILDGPSIIKRVLIKGKQEESKEEEGDMTMEPQVGMMNFEEGRRGHK